MPFTVMLVEDSALLVRELTQTLGELAGGDVRVSGVAASEEQALRLMRAMTTLPDLLLVDVFLAAGSGLGVLRAAKVIDPDARVAVLTNFATLDVRKRCVALGAERAFDKTTQLEELLAYVERLALQKAASNAANAQRATSCDVAR